jgi:hypothetical protein
MAILFKSRLFDQPALTPFKATVPMGNEIEFSLMRTPVQALKVLSMGLLALNLVFNVTAAVASDSDDETELASSVLAASNASVLHREYPNNYSGRCESSVSGNDGGLFDGALPKIKRVVGDKSVVCTTVPDTAELAGKCKRMIESVAKFYRVNSRDQLRLFYKDSGGGDYRFRVDPSRHNNNVTWQSQFLSTVARHEFGHKIGLGHSSDTKTGRNHDPDKYFYDTTTIMNGHAIGSPYLNSVQYYLKGWLPQEAIAHYNGATSTDYTLSRINDFDGGDLSTVIVTPDNYPPVFISWPPASYCKAKGVDKCFTVHYLRAEKATRRLGTQDTGEFCMPEIGLKITMVPNGNPEQLTINLNRY